MHQEDDDHCNDDHDEDCAEADVPPPFRETVPPEPMLAFVRVGTVFNGKLAILEKETSEPLQFVPVGGRSHQEVVKLAEKLAKTWDEYFQHEVSKRVRN